MAKIFDNQLLLFLVGGLILYWGPGQFVPGAFVSMIVSIGLLIFGGMAFFQYVGPAYDIVVKKRRDATEKGSHLWVLGTFLAAAGIMYSGAYGGIWIWLDQPPHWSGTLMSSFGRAMIAVGMALQWWAPKVGSGSFEVRTGLWIWVAIVVSFLGGMLFSAKFSFPDNEFRFSMDRPLCPATHPVWGSSTHIYHTPASPYRAMLKPTRCFKDVAEAEAAGFVAAKWLN